MIRIAFLGILVLLVAPPASVLAQAQRPAQRQPAAPRPVTPVNGEQPAPGLDALDDERVLTEIAGRGLADLLRHALDRQNVPEDQRTALLARISLSRLQSPEPMSTLERRELVRDVAANVEETLEQTRDAQLLFEQAQLLMDRGVNEETRLLEYFGENPELRRYLRPVIEAISRMLERSAELFEQEANRLADRINNPNDPVARQWRALDQAARQARDYRIFADYNRILAIDPDSPQRLQLADRLLGAVGPADNPNNPRRTFVQTYLGKVALARGKERGLEAARGYFEQVIAAGSDPRELFDAYYFRTVAEIEDRKLPEARQQLKRFRQWFDQQDLPEHQPLMIVLEYRLEDSAGRFAPSSEARQAANQRATQALVRLVEQYEGYRAVVTEQLLARVTDETDLGQLSPLLLDAMVDRARAEAARMAQARVRQDQAEEQVDEQAIERGIQAAEELVRRSAAGEAVEPGTVGRNAFLKGLMLDLLGRRIEAVEAFAALEQTPGAALEQRIAAYRRAIGIVADLKRSADLSEAERIRLDAAEGQLLPLLVGPPVNDATWAFDLANRLHRLGQLEQAAQYYAQVPQEDPRRVDAIYLRLLAQSARLSELERASPARAAVAAEMPRLGEQARQQLQAALQESPPEMRDAYRERLVRVNTLMARHAINELDEPEQALALLETIEQEVEGLDNAPSLLGSALPLRFQATAATGQIDQATQDLLTLLGKSDARRGLAYIAQFREALNRAMEAAQARGDAEAQQQIMQTRAAVTPRLVAWIEQNDDPEYQRYVYNFRRFDAETQHQAALRATDAAERRQRLRRALEAFEALESPENVQRYRALLGELPPEQQQLIVYDREVVFAIGNIHFELGDYEEARSRYGRLLADRAMGNATRTIEQDGVARLVPNDEFWELYLKFIRSNLALGNAPERMAQELRTLYAAHGNAVGGNRWRQAFEELRRELIPDFRPPVADSGAAAGSPAAGQPGAR